MTPSCMKARFIQEVGTKGRLRIYWDRYTVTSIDDHGYHTWSSLNTCPNCLGGGKPGYHNAYTPLGDTSKVGAGESFGKEADYAPERWPTACHYCGEAVPPDTRPVKLGESGAIVHHQVFTNRLYDTASGDPEPGDIYETRFHESRKCPFWDNCEGTHLYVILPNGAHWDIDSRASNCTKKYERTHRCWIRHGTPPDLTVDKNGFTCEAGAGSIDVPGWHGFLRGGQLVL